MGALIVAFDDGMELGRLTALRRCGILDTPPEGAFDRITKLAADLLNVPVSVVSFVDGHRIWFKSVDGAVTNREMDRGQGYCDRVVAERRPYLVEAVSLEPEVRQHSLHLDGMKIEFYVGVPLTTQDGHVIGALACMDSQPRRIDSKQMHGLDALAAIVMDETELRRSALQISRLSEALAASCHDMERRAGYDPLTGVLTRDAMLERSGRLISRARSGTSGAAVLLLDVDRFRMINDACGPAAGDRVLREVAARLVRRCRGHDLIGRIGGDSFLAVFSEVTFEQATAIATRLRESICGQPVSLTSGGPPMDVSVSGGLAVMPASDAPFDIEVTLRSVEGALHLAKEAGRNRVALARRPGEARV